MNVHSPNKWWSTLKSALSSSLPLLVSEGDGLVSESVGKGDLLSDHLDSKQSGESVDLPLTCYPSLVWSSLDLCLQVERCQASLIRLGPLSWH